MLEKMRQKDIKKLKDKVSNTLMLDALEIESERNWPTIGTLDKRVNADVTIP